MKKIEEINKQHDTCSQLCRLKVIQFWFLELSPCCDCEQIFWGAFFTHKVYHNEKPVIKKKKILTPKISKWEEGANKIILHNSAGDNSSPSWVHTHKTDGVDTMPSNDNHNG